MNIAKLNICVKLSQLKFSFPNKEYATHILQKRFQHCPTFEPLDLGLYYLSPFLSPLLHIQDAGFAPAVVVDAMG